MKKLLCIGLLIIGCAPESVAMNTIKKTAKWLPGICIVNGATSMASGTRDGMDGGVMKGKALMPRTISVASACALLAINPLFFVCNVVTQGSIYKTAYKKGQSFRCREY